MSGIRVVFPLLVFSALTFGQSPTGEIAGLVTDPSGAAVPGAAVSIRHAATGFTRETVTNQSGRYSFGSLIAGAYELRGGAAGFRTLSLTADVATGIVTTIDL